MRRLLNRRLFGASLLASTGVLSVQRMRTSGRIRDGRRPESRVAILHADSYARSLEEKITNGLRLFGLELHGKSVLLKPNLVEFIRGAEVNTNPLLVGAAACAFLALGAKTVVVAEGPGHQWDTYLVLAQSGFESQLRDRKLSFVDLNRDDVRRVKVTTPFTGLDSLWIPQSILAAVFIVSMPKVKTHHWAGVTLSLKNQFGTIPGSVYGWPKNLLHWKGIDRSILDINSAIPAYSPAPRRYARLRGIRESPWSNGARSNGTRYPATTSRPSAFRCGAAAFSTSAIQPTLPPSSSSTKRSRATTGPARTPSASVSAAWTRAARTAARTM